MRTVNIHEAKTHLSRLIDAAMKGESFIIAKATYQWCGSARLRLLKSYSNGVWGFLLEKSGCPKILIAWDRTILCLCSTVRHEAPSGYPSAALGSRRA